MALIKNGEFKEYGEKEKFFKLDDDGDIKLVRFLHRNITDVPVVTFHMLNIDGYDRKVSCLRTYDEPLSKCPLCAKNDRYQSRKYLELLVYETDSKGNPTGKAEIQIWDRGKKFIDKLKSIQQRLEKRGKLLCDVLFDIERVGKKGDTSTSYELYERTDLNSNDYEFEFPEESYNPIGKSIFDYSEKELKNILEGKPAEEDGVERRETTEKVERRESSERNSEVKEDEPQGYRRASRRL